MFSLSLLAISSFLLALLLTPLIRNLARRWGLFDPPDGGRHLHHDPIPRVGGVPIAIAYLAAFGILFLAQLQAGSLVHDSLPLIVRLLPAAALIFVIGLFDDLRGLSPSHKFVGQLVAALLAVSAGVYIEGVAGVAFPVWIGAPLTVLWLVGCANAFNLIDGVDGLAAGVGLFATITMLLAALLGNNIPLALATIPLAGALLGFLRYNFNPATIFLGDCGSLTVGFLLGCFGTLWSQKAATALGMTAPLMALSIPLLDTALAIARRFLRNEPIFKADRGHIHHRLLDRGLTPRRVALLLYAAAGLGAIFSVLQSTMDSQFGGLVLLLFCAMVWIGVQHLGYVEFGAAGRMFMDGAFRRHLNSQLALNVFEKSLASANTPQDYWQAVREACRRFGFTQAELKLNGDHFRETLVDTNGNPTWKIQIPLDQDGYLTLTRCFGTDSTPTVLVPFADALHRNIHSFNAKQRPKALSAVAR